MKFSEIPRNGQVPALFFQIVRKNKWGFINRSGRIVIAPSFADEHDFFCGLTAVEMLTGKWAYIDESGNRSLPARFDEAGDFVDSLAPVKIGRGCGYIDKTGKVVIAPQFSEAHDFFDGLAAVRLEENSAGKYGYIDRSGRMVIAPHFNQANSFSDGLAAVETSGRVVGNQIVDEAWGFINKTGALQIPDKY